MYLILILFFSLIFPNQTLAQTATSSANSSKAVLDMVEKKVQDMLQQNNSVSNIPKTIVGEITSINNSKVGLINPKKEKKDITIINETVFVDAKKNKTKFETLKSGQTILAMGYYDQYNNFEAKRVVITSTDSIINKNEIVFGQIVDISQTSNVLVLIPIKNKNIQYQIKIDSKTSIIDQNGISLTIDKMKSGQKIIAIIQPNSKIANTFDAAKIITLSTVSSSPTPTPKK